MSMLFLILLQDIVFTIYLSYRLYQSFFTKYNKAFIILSIMVSSNLFIILKIISKNTDIVIPYILNFISTIIFAVCIYIFMLYLVTDIIRIIFKRLHKQFISHYIQGLIVTITAVLVCALGYLNNHTTKINEYNIVLNKEIIEPFKIAALSDIHIGSDMTSSRLYKEIKLINDIKPDIVFITGDIIDNNIKDYKEEYIKEFQKINAPLGTYVVFGNHEYYSGNQADIIKLFEKSGFHVLVDNVTYIPEKEFYIIGRDSLRHTNSKNDERTSIETLYKQVEDKTKPVIILDHIPKSSLDGRKINADIQISGHTHDGQFFPGNLIVNKMYELSHGMKNYDGFHYFVSSGLGLWGPPIRIGTDSEILIINVTGK